MANTLSGSPPCQRRGGREGREGRERREGVMSSGYELREGKGREGRIGRENGRENKKG